VNRRELTKLLRDAGFKIVTTSSAVRGCGKSGVHRIVNSYKVNMLIRQTGLQAGWQRFTLNRDFGRCLTPLPRLSDSFSG
jgi:hypothetical protein